MSRILSNGLESEKLMTAILIKKLGNKVVITKEDVIEAEKDAKLYEFDTEIDGTNFVMFNQYSDYKRKAPREEELMNMVKNLLKELQL